MSREPLQHVVQCLHTQAGPSDADLLARYASAHDESAFELLVWRHGGMVHGVCWRILGNEHDAQDAFQATFLTLARQRLRAALMRRGFAVPVAMLAVVPVREAPAALVAVTSRAATAFALGQSAAAPAAALAEGVLRAMMFTKLKVVAAVLLIVG